MKLLPMECGIAGLAKYGGALLSALFLLLPVSAGASTINAYTPFPVGSPRVMGMGGAVTGIANGADVILANPASLMEPDGFDIRRIELGYLLSTVVSSGDDDFGNTGSLMKGDEAAEIYGLGLLWRHNRRDNHRPLGYGLVWGGEKFIVTDDPDVDAYDWERMELNVQRIRLLFGGTFREERLRAAIALSYPSPSFFYEPDTGDPFTIRYESYKGGWPLELGFLWAEEGGKLRVGCRLSGPVAGNAGGDIPLDPAPDTIIDPGELAVGVSYKFGESRRGGFGWFDSVILDFDLKTTLLSIDETIGMEAFRETDPLEILPSRMVQPALGMEVEVYSRSLFLWAGTYYEPQRYEDVPGRTHVTGGLRVYLFTVCGIGIFFEAAWDAAERYSVGTISISTGTR